MYFPSFFLLPPWRLVNYDDHFYSLLFNASAEGSVQKLIYQTKFAKPPMGKSRDADKESMIKK